MSSKIITLPLAFFKKFKEKNVLLHLLILIEIILMIWLSLSAVLRPTQTIHISPEAFNTDSYEGIFMQDSALRFENDNDTIENHSISFKEEYELVPGAYEITAYYDSYISDDKKVSDSSVHLSFKANDTILADGLLLDDGHDSVTRIFWIPMGSNVEEMEFILDYSESGTLDFYGIDINERMSYRIIGLVGIALIFLLADILLYIFFGEGVRRSQNTIVFLTLGVTVLLSSLPLLSTGILQGHDMHFHMVRIASVATELKNGQFPVRMMSEMCNGYGYGNSLFYCDIFLLIPAILHNLAVSLTASYKIYVAIINIATALISFYAFSRISKDKMIGLLGAVFYTLSTYRLINLHIRASVGEYTAMVFLPLVVLGMYLIYTSDRPKLKDWLPLALGMSGVIMSHILSVLMVVIFLAVFCIIYIKKTLNLRRLCAIACAVGTTLAITAWFLIPFLQTYITTKTQVSENELNSLQGTGISFQHLFDYGNHGAVYIYGSNEMSSLTVGISVLTGLAIILIYVYKRHEWKNRDLENYRTLSPFLWLGMLAIAFTLIYFPWSKVQQTIITLLGDRIGGTIAGLLGSIQFSWRFLTIATVLLISGTIIAVATLKKFAPTLKKTLTVILSVSIIFSVAGVYLDLSKGSGAWRCLTISHIDTMNVMVGEYYLNETEPSQLNSAIPSVISGDVEIADYTHEDDIYVTCINRSGEEAVIDIPVFAYNNYHAYDTKSGEELVISKSPVNNRIAITLPEGYDGTVSVQYVSPTLWRVMEIVSAVAVLALIVLAVKTLADRYRLRALCQKDQASEDDKDSQCGETISDKNRKAEENE